jgi:hypothetical protein
MRKMTVLRKFYTVKAMRDAIAAYTQNYFATAIPQEHIAMFANDIARAADALASFIATSDAVELHTTIVYFDTDMREQFVSVLRYIEENELVPQTEYCVL